MLLWKKIRKRGWRQRCIGRCLGNGRMRIRRDAHGGPSPRAKRPSRRGRQCGLDNRGYTIIRYINEINQLNYSREKTSLSSLCGIDLVDSNALPSNFCGPVTSRTHRILRLPRLDHNWWHTMIFLFPNFKLKYAHIYSIVWQELKTANQRVYKELKSWLARQLLFTILTLATAMLLKRFSIRWAFL